MRLQIRPSAFNDLAKDRWFYDSFLRLCSLTSFCVQESQKGTDESSGASFDRISSSLAEFKNLSAPSPKTPIF